MRSINEAMRDYGQGITLGQPPSPCYEHCPVMQDQVTVEHRDKKVHEKLEGFRLAVYSLTDQKLRGSETLGTDMPGYLEDLGAEGINQADYCAFHVARGECAILDIVPRDLNGVAAYTTNDSTMHLLEGIVRPNAVIASPMVVLIDGDSATVAPPKRAVLPDPDQAFRKVIGHVDSVIKRKRSSL